MSTFLSTAALASFASSQSVYQTTATLSGDTLTLPGGYTRPVGGVTITGSAAVISGITVIANSQQIAFLSDHAVQVGNAQVTNDLNGVTIVDGSIPGGSAPAATTPATTTNSGASDGGQTITGGLGVTTTSQGSAVTSTTAVTSSTTKPNVGDLAFGSAQMLGWAGAAVGAAAVANL